MENLDIFGSSLLDFSSANSTIAIQYQWELKEEVNSIVLQDALDNTLEQFPYFRKTLINNNGIAIYVENPYPVFIRKSDQYENVGSFINNYHLVQVTYDENTIIKKESIRFYNILKFQKIMNLKTTRKIVILFFQKNQLKTLTIILNLIIQS